VAGLTGRESPQFNRASSLNYFSIKKSQDVSGDLIRLAAISLYEHGAIREFSERMKDTRRIIPYWDRVAN
jgi:hypothetical protein